MIAGKTCHQLAFVGFNCVGMFFASWGFVPEQSRMYIYILQ